MKRMLAVFLILALMCALPCAALADSQAMVKMQYADGSLHLRAGEGTGFASNGFVKNGAAITVLSTGAEWSKIRVNASGREGYIKNIYISYVSSDTPVMERGKNVYVSENGGSLKVRAGEGTTYAVNGYVQHGDAITLLSVGDVWSKIKVNRSGVTGYIKNDYIYGYATAGWSLAVEEILNGNAEQSGTAYEAAVVVTRYADSVVNVRAAASTSSEVIAKVMRGAFLKVLGSENGWYKVITTGGTVGFISKSYVSMGVPAKTTAGLNVRKNAGSSSELITTLAKGTGVTILNVDGNWCRIKYGKSAYGYVSIRYLKY